MSLQPSALVGQPSALVGQPSASAIGFHIAITIGDSTIGSPGGASGLVRDGRSCQVWLSSVRYAPDAGLNTTGCSLPSRIAVIASPEPIALPLTAIGRPSWVRGDVRWNAAICCSSQVFFSLP